MDFTNNIELINDTLAELNAIRTNPNSYAKKIKEYCKYFKGKLLKIPGGANIMTNEGIISFQEAYDFLLEASPLEPLKMNNGLVYAAQEYINEIVQYDDLDDARDIDIESIIGNYGYFSGEFRQSTDFGSSTPELIAINLIVDDGDRDREMRKVLFSDCYNEIGIANAKHPTFNSCTVLLFTTKFVMTVKKDNPPEQDNHKEISSISKGLLKNGRNQSAKDNPIEDNEGEDLKETNKPLKNQLNKTKVNKNTEVNDISDDMPEDVVKMERNEKFIEEKGIKKKVIKITMYKEDGSKHVEITKEPL